MLEDEKYLETLIHAGRTGPDAAQVERIERRLDPWFRSAQGAGATSRVRGLGTHTSKVRLIVAVLGLGLVTSVSQTREVAMKQDELQPVERSMEATSLPTRVLVSAEPPANIAPPAPPAPVRAAVRPPTTTVPASPSPTFQDTPAAASPAAVADSNPPPKTEDPPEAPSPPRARAPSGESEVAYLRRAQAALSSDPRRALALADEHPSRFPNAALVQEREVIAIDALVKLQRVAEARTRVAAFRARFPGSAHLAHVVSAVGAAP